MKLAKANTHLRRAGKARAASLWISAKSSSAIEGIHKPFENQGPADQPSSMAALVDYWKKAKRTKTGR
jgi:hypothetical protein